MTEEQTQLTLLAFSHKYTLREKCENQSNGKNPNKILWYEVKNGLHLKPPNQWHTWVQILMNKIEHTKHFSLIEEEPEINGVKTVFFINKHPILTNHAQKTENSVSKAWKISIEK
ncbi:MAG: hypothetical protein JSW56_12430 [Deltaproteobacteria bacterium]|nr:MAG: hypothetical protein JSW56_12430 [Deltaproteobacteria bacterium]